MRRHTGKQIECWTQTLLPELEVLLGLPGLRSPDSALCRGGV
ncbi:hypothetical protein PC129_g11830 [Phytophthora cactorum]|uniref:Uncharacterized protein n=1 Tax=Phytophthora cactorum TaxID=29920 RepID=A0A329T570_9STRA|nr:hypothetical protein Pcac1_g10951 [Phytophthora cactorum]KAG3082873.1 hypothetical protein PI125_g19868 [Phytophthora idaei]KAG2815880.1 hypothetical protein PC112_g13681 [Phytophthora cactorum]KAG2828175.1 hypothetical protein PC111_g8288 [Phytophthora cactorum]KAG2850492.1 hypothetical protein PC113_g16727 [Phytophthora cactorum]